ncbi:photosynthetic complex assembly protein PuhC [Rhodobacter ferrooxidans]|uniref:Photosynthetic complex assembly protein n=1 Tax=Rhodobacter ferrooxidans TaxID=371731 RepID=C8RYM2_9RHOB|nr:photosynthetic complex assembly protein PuhC [Rhodobacter sp. SW2]EEW26210.1 photosynthetic complex assembly protein [Rhodobacter sp. SW2]
MPPEIAPKPHDSHDDMIPKGLLRAIGVLLVVSIALVSYAVLTGREHVGQPKAAAVIEERQIILVGLDAQAVKVLNTDGTVLVDLPHGGFITVIQNGLQRARKLRGVDQMKPVRLVRYENGRLSIIDPETGWTAELHAFGDDNRAAFERLMAM